MRTKTLLFTAAVVAAGFTAASAQSVYSVNAVGYVNLNIGTGFTLIANPLNTTNNTLGSVLPTVPDFTLLYKWNEGLQGFAIASYFEGWDHPEFTLNPGEGAFINPPEAFTATFVGEVMQGNVVNPVPANFSIKSSQIPQTGTAPVLGLVPGDFDILYKWNTGTQSYDIYSYFEGWTPSDPVINVGESVFLSSGGAYSWTRSFSVN